jgi:ABC-type phosphate transport system substrate-binding protein
MGLRRRLDLLSKENSLTMRRLTGLIVALMLVPWQQADPARADAHSPESVAGQESFSEPLVIVVNRSNPVENLSFADLRNIFLGRRSHWVNGRRITLVMRDPGEAERKTILRDVCGMDEYEFKTLFLRGLYSGEILVSPKILSTPSGVRKFIFNVPGAIGYLRMSDVDTTVKVVRIDERNPTDKGYRLRVDVQAVN